MLADAQAQSTPGAAPPLPWYRIWISALLRPTVAHYTSLQSQPNVTFGRALLWIAVASIASGILSYALSPGLIGFDPASGILALSLGVDYVSIIWAVLLFLVIVPVEHGLARIIGGRGRFSQLAFLTAAFSSLLILLHGILSGVGGALTAPSLIEQTDYGIYAVTTFGYVPVFITVAQLGLVLVRALLGWVAVRAVYSLGAMKALIPATAPFILLVCLIGLWYLI